MRNIRTVADLKDAISELEFNKSVHQRMLRDSLNSSIENLKPVNVLRNIAGAFVNPGLFTKVIPAVLGMGAAYLSNKFTNRLIGRGGKTRIRKVLITLAMYGVERTLVRNPEINRYFGSRIVHSVFS